jgi:hypothetical protein
MEFEKHGKTSEQAIYPELGESEGKSFKSNMNPQSQCLFYFYFLISSILLCGQSGDHPQEDLAKFGYKLDMNVKSLS